MTVAATALPRLRSKSAWIRMWDFPRLQIAVLGSAALVPIAGKARTRAWPWRLAATFLGTAVAFQWSRIWHYTPLAPREVEDARSPRGERTISLVVANVLQHNRDAARVRRVVEEADPDVILFAETDRWWCDQLASFARTHPYRVEVPLDNLYGMALYSRLALADEHVEHLCEPGIPSIHARVRLRDGSWIFLHCMHPRAPAPDKSRDSLERDTELVRLAYRVRDAGCPVIVCGDLNDVAWSRTTRQFQRISRLLDPRRGRGFYSTYPAHAPGLRFPLDHFFHSEHFRLRTLRVLPPIGSDHFAVLARLSYEPSAEHSQEPPHASTEDAREARETVAASESKRRL
ncbi:MAG TPA: endonuclease/exonuclease/phosphatase family protein [Burkholderiales bacterium]|nr:endonuclease/exonuclease/phosphatase family protein [Burkholderiales bacterium]